MNNKLTILLMGIFSIFLFQSCKMHDLRFTRQSFTVCDSVIDLSFSIFQPKLNIKLDPFSFRNTFHTSTTEDSKKYFFIYSDLNSLSSDTRKYTDHILHLCHSEQDTIMVMIPGRMIMLKEQTPDQHYSYANFWDFTNSQWKGTGDYSLNEYFIKAPRYFKNVYRDKKNKTIIIKDTFSQLSVIYILQGFKKQFEAYTPCPIYTCAYDPIDFHKFMSVSYWIMSDINPISEQIAMKLYQSENL